MGEKVRLRPVRASDVGEEHHLVMDSVRAYATVFVGNVGSRRALEKNGFPEEHIPVPNQSFSI